MRRLELSAKKAAILAEASLAKEQYDLEFEQTKIKQRMQQLDVKRRLAVLEAEDEVLAQADNEADGRHSSVVLHDLEIADMPVNTEMSNSTTGVLFQTAE